MHIHIAVLVIIVNSVFVKGNSLYWPIYEYADNIRTMCVELNFMSYILQIQRLCIYKKNTESSVACNNVVYQIFQLLVFCDLVQTS